MSSIFEKNRLLNSVYVQMVFIIAAFIIMLILSSFFFVRNERRHLTKDTKNMFDFAETIITANILEYKIFLTGFSETIRNMLLDGNNEDEISGYMTTISNLTGFDKELINDLDALYGYFFTWGEKYIGNGDISLPDDFNIHSQIWYQAAVEAQGKIAVLEPHVNNRETILTLSRYITDDRGSPLGVICADITLDRILSNAADINITENSYGIMLNNNLEIIAHPELYFKGLNIHDTRSDISRLSPELKAGRNITGQRIKNYRYENTIVYFQKIKYGWYFGIVISASKHSESLIPVIALITVIGSMLAAALCVMIHKISKARLQSDQRTQQKSNFLATMSHEIRTPLNAILGMTEIQMQSTIHPPATSEAFIKINNSSNLLLNIINDILDLSKIEAGKLELVLGKYEVASLINDVIQLNYIRYESKPIEFILEIDENIPSMLVGDELRIKQILNNLLSNAFKYTSHGQVTLAATAECVGRGGGAVIVTLIFQIKDTGQGMTQEQINKLFDEYTRFNLEANRTTEGAGLGMTITRNLTDLMYGKIHVKSEVGEGTTVTVRLPQKTDGAGISGVLGRQTVENLQQFKIVNVIQQKKSQIAHEYMPYGSILIVDDVETNLYVAKGLMTPYGLKIELAASGFEAIDKVKEGNLYDIIFMDHMMPKMDGIETTKRLREMGYTRPVVALTANALAGQAEVFLKNGFDGFVSKPIDVRQLNTTLNKLIRDKYPSEVIEAAQKEKAKMDKELKTGNTNQKIDSQLAVIFARDAGKALATLETCMENKFNNENDIQTYIINTHAMKSALANIGQKDISANASRLEQAGRDKNINVMLTETPEFLDGLHRVINEIKPKDETNEKIQDTKDALVYLHEKLGIIREACLVFDKKSIKNALNELREKTWSSKSKEIIEKTSEHLLHSEFDDISDFIDKYLKEQVQS